MAFTPSEPSVSAALAEAYKASSHLLPDRTQQRDFFVADLLDVSPKSDSISMEHPLFALRAGDKRIRTYERNGNAVTVLPGATGCATIHDKDLWIYCIGQLVEAANRGRQITPIVRFTAYDFLAATNRDTSGRAYERMIEMMRRLAGTRIETNIETNGQRERRGFGLIDSWRVVERSPDNNRMVAVEVELPRWLYRAVEVKQVLTLSRGYFRLRKPLDRRVYELARKHCGKQPVWRVSLAVLHEKSGSAASLREFRRQIKALAESGVLPDYFMAFEGERDLVTFYAEGSKGRVAKLGDMLCGRLNVSLAAHNRRYSSKSQK